MLSDNYKFWKNVWDAKGNSNSEDLLFLDGYDHLDAEFSSKKITNKIINNLKVEKGSSILEVACGCGFLARDLNDDYNFVGVDYSESIIKKHKELFDHEVYVCESNNLKFKADSFDYVFCYGLFQYLPDSDYAKQTIEEMSRVARKGVFIGDLKNIKTRETHFVMPKKQFIDFGFTIIDAESTNDGAERFSAFRRFE